MKLLTFLIEDQQFALPLDSIEQVVQAVDISSLPDTPDYISGVVNYHGNILPVLNTRNLFNLNKRELETNDQFIIVKTTTVFMALWVDSTRVVADIPKNKIIDIKKINYGEKRVKAVVKSEKEIILLKDVDKFLDKKELQEIEKALKKARLPKST